MQAIVGHWMKLDPRIITYGEGWDMVLGSLNSRQGQEGQCLPDAKYWILHDDQRDAIKGGEVYGSIKAGPKGGAATELIVAKAILVAESWAHLSPTV